MLAHFVYKSYLLFFLVVQSLALSSHSTECCFVGLYGRNKYILLLKTFYEYGSWLLDGKHNVKIFGFTRGQFKIMQITRAKSLFIF